MHFFRICIAAMLFTAVVTGCSGQEAASDEAGEKKAVSQKSDQGGSDEGSGKKFRGL